ncbi:hypothetical protein Sjap_014722 [Stephania japonica]|uniref:cAMP-regulated phosphoprotein 19-related protein n=1 Tax=Stephania japonica TaxID=461633 RepID=A0AAP0IIA1_9MAGN
MSGANVEDTTMKEIVENSPKDEIDGQLTEEPKLQDETESTNMPSQEEQEAKAKYGGILRKKPPLISKDHERAFFDSADWALGKQGAGKPKGPLEALRPKLQPTQQQARSRRSPYAPANADEDVGGNNVNTPED